MSTAAASQRRAPGASDLRLLRRLMGSNVVGMAFLRSSGEVIDANDAFLRTVGFTRDDLHSGAVDFRALLPSFEGTARIDFLTALVAEGRCGPLDLELSRRDGEQVPVLLAASLSVRGEPGVAIVLDCSEGKRKDAALRTAEERVRTLLQVAPFSLFAFDRDGVITTSEGTALREIGLEPARGLGSSLFTRWAHVPEIVASARRALQGEEFATRLEIGARVFDTVYRPLLDRDGRPDGAIGAALDATERVRAAEERARLHAKLLQLQKLESLGVLAGGIAHGFNNLLAGILGNAQAALLELPQDHPAREALSDVVGAAQRGASLTRQMLAYAGRSSPASHPVDLAEQIRSLAPLLQESLPRAARLELRLSEALPRIRGEPDQLRQALLALVTNAGEALDDRGGTVTVSTRLVELDAEDVGTIVGEALGPGWCEQIEVRDDGVGMAPETLARAFDPLFTTKQEGRGLGLAAVLAIVRGLRGGVRLRSAPGQGTTVQLVLPLGSGAEAAPAHPPPRSGADGPRGVLIVDDDPQVRSAARRILRAARHPVFEAKGGSEALAECRASASQIGVILLDLTMPARSGDLMLGELRALAPRAQIVLCSGYPREEATSRIEGTLAGFLAKPFTAEELVAQVRAALAAGAGAQEPAKD